MATLADDLLEEADAIPKLAQHGDGVLAAVRPRRHHPTSFARFPSRDGNEAPDRALAPTIEIHPKRVSRWFSSLRKGHGCEEASMEIAGFALLFLTVAGVVVWSMLNAREPARGD